MTCLNNYNDRGGTYVTLRDISYYEGLDYDGSQINNGDGCGSNYENIDKYKVCFMQ